MRKLVLALCLLPCLAYAQPAGVGYGQPSTAVEASRILKPAGGRLYGFQVNTGASSGWVLLFDSATVPADGAVTPVKWWQVNSATTLGIEYDAAPLLLLNGITLVFSTTGPFTKTGSATATFSGEVQ